jgi:dolichol kinase
VGCFIQSLAVILYLYYDGSILITTCMVLTFLGIAALGMDQPGNLDNLTVPIAIHISKCQRGCLEWWW